MFQKKSNRYQGRKFDNWINNGVAKQRIKLLPAIEILLNFISIFILKMQSEKLHAK